MVPATWEAKAGGSFEPINSRAAWLEMDNPTQKCINKMDTIIKLRKRRFTLLRGRLRKET